ncbi:hypothetical protein [Shewanella sp. UCD-FRSSP16_17]|uniref:hypothetical protein n=1 Tax=Shewanella sp. UCD-FRSSP16_17 TaxID=1853256 RepID=UPI0012E6FF21|nr:hypothetical protein [Shewanella sp. UCD-FRSSP16_17]
MKQVISSVVMLIFVDYLSFNKQRLPYNSYENIRRRDTCLQSMFVVQYRFRSIAILTLSVIVPHPMLDPLH